MTLVLVPRYNSCRGPGPHYLRLHHLHRYPARGVTRGGGKSTSRPQGFISFLAQLRVARKYKCAISFLLFSLDLWNGMEINHKLQSNHNSIKLLSIGNTFTWYRNYRVLIRSNSSYRKSNFELKCLKISLVAAFSWWWPPSYSPWSV